MDSPVYIVTQTAIHGLRVLHTETHRHGKKYIQSTIKIVPSYYLV